MFIYSYENRKNTNSLRHHGDHSFDILSFVEYKVYKAFDEGPPVEHDLFDLREAFNNV